MRKKILFLLEDLGGGGAEKVLSTIVEYMDREKFDVTICAVTAGGQYDKVISERTHFYTILQSPKSYKGIGKLWYWIKYHMIYDWLPMWLAYDLFVPKGNAVEIAFVEGFATKLLSYSTNSKAKRIAWVHCDLKNQPWPIQHGIYKDKDCEMGVYRQYDKVVCVSGIVEQVMREHYGLSNTTTIYNPLDNQRILQLATQDTPFSVNVSQYNIISVGRLEYVKGFDKLIPIIQEVRENGVDVHLWIVGEGTEEQTLKNMANERAMEQYVTFTGFMKNPYSLMSQMNLFVCSSRAEGFSLVIAEAMTLGVPVVSMNCAGPRELITNNVGGVLCDSYEDLKNAILDKAKNRMEYSKDIIASTIKNDINTIMSQINYMLECV